MPDTKMINLRNKYLIQHKDMNQEMDPLNLTEGQQAEKDEMNRKRQIKLEKAEIARVKRCEYTAEYQRGKGVGQQLSEKSV